MLSLILPTYNEAANLPELLKALKEVLAMPHEIIIVDDDSPDQTWKVAEELKKTYPSLRVLRRVGRRGLSSAVTDGFAMSVGDVLMVMDADLQHDPQLINTLYTAVINGADIAVASRYSPGGSVGDWVTGRRLLSKIATWLANRLPPVHSTDPMSGFFAVRRTAYNPIAAHLRPTGFKILLEVLAHLSSSSVIAEVPLHFAFRKHGESKLNMRVQLEFIFQLVRIVCMRIVAMVRKWQVMIFLIAVAIAIALLVQKAWHLRLLYTDPHIRQQTQSTLQRVAHEQGWLLSDMLVQEVGKDDVRILHRTVHRNADHVDCFHLPFDGSDPVACVAQ